MLDAAAKAIAQMFSKQFRSVLLRSAAVALGLLVAIGIWLHRFLFFVAERGGAWLEGSAGEGVHTPVRALEVLLSILAGVGVTAAIVFLMPAITSLVAGFFVDEIAEGVERTYYPEDVAGAALPIGRAVVEGIKASLLGIGVYLCAVPFLLVAGLGAIMFFLATAFVLARVYFQFAATRFHAAAEAKRLYRLHRGTIFVAGLFIALFVSIPVVNLATPLFATAFMVHLHKRLTQPARLATTPPQRLTPPAS